MLMYNTDHELTDRLQHSEYYLLGHNITLKVALYEIFQFFYFFIFALEEISISFAKGGVFTFVSKTTSVFLIIGS